ncbi:MAG: hydroxyethylthiazole kinase [Pseudomonadota bacterium]
MDNPGKTLHDMRSSRPLVHNVTNFVAMNVMANVLLAVGASPAMVHAREEVADFATISQALTVNIGTLEPDWVDAMEMAAKTMAKAAKPWVFDPVGVGATAYRQEASKRLLALNPTVVRGNASEILALAGLGGSGKGVDSGDTVCDAEAAARQLAHQTGGVVAVSGEVDFVTDGSRAFRIANGHPLMGRITVMGCSLNGVIAAFCTAARPLEATAAALACYGLAGETAGSDASGPGSFQSAFLDALHAQTPDLLNEGAQITSVMAEIA